MTVILILKLLIVLSSLLLLITPRISADGDALTDSNNRLHLDIDISALHDGDHPDGEWHDDVYIQLVAANHHIVCEHNLAGLHNGKIPCNVELKHLRKGKNPLHANIRSHHNDEIVEQFDLSFELADVPYSDNRKPFYKDAKTMIVTGGVFALGGMSASIIIDILFIVRRDGIFNPFNWFHDGNIF
jgi:hypothetical protein